MIFSDCFRTTPIGIIRIDSFVGRLSAVLRSFFVHSSFYAYSFSSNGLITVIVCSFMGGLIHHNIGYTPRHGGRNIYHLWQLAVEYRCRNPNSVYNKYFCLIDAGFVTQTKERIYSCVSTAIQRD